MQMAQLAEVMGVPLFEKRGRSLALTQAGETLLPYARRVTQTLRDAGEALDALKGVGRGKVKRWSPPRVISRRG